MFIIVWSLTHPSTLNPSLHFVTLQQRHLTSSFASAKATTATRGLCYLNVNMCRFGPLAETTDDVVPSLGGQSPWAVLYGCSRPCLHANNHSGNWQRGLGELRLACWQRLFGTADSKAYCSPSLFLPASFRSEWDGWDWGNTLLLTLTCCRLCREVRGQGFLPCTTMYKLLHRTTLEAGRGNTWKKEKSSKLFGKDIKNTLRCQFQFPRVVQDIVRDTEPGRVLVVVQ